MKKSEVYSENLIEEEKKKIEIINENNVEEPAKPQTKKKKLDDTFDNIIMEDEPDKQINVVGSSKKVAFNPSKTPAG